MYRVLPFAAALVVASTTAACSGSSSTATTPSQTITTEVALGIVQPPVNGVPQSFVNNFTVGQGGGTISVTLTSAIETLPGGTLLTTVTMGIALGQPSGTACVLLANASNVGQGGSAAELSGTVAAGTYCVVVSDVTNQLGPVAYALSIAHP